MIPLLPIATLLTLGLLSKADVDCTLTASGGDDSPQIEAAFSVRLHL